MTYRKLMLAVVMLAVVPAVALAKAPARPAAGKWKLSPFFNSVSAGGFAVNKSQRTVSGFKLTTGPGNSTSCPTGKLSVSGNLKLRTASRGGFTVWIVGRNAPKVSDGVATIKVKVKQNGKSIPGGRLKLIFQSKTSGDGELDFPNQCQIAFGIGHHGH